jgi:CRP-like cAMP-binding protein
MKSNVKPCNCIECENVCDFFKRLSLPELHQINDAKIAVKYKKGEVILKKGIYSPYILLISSGYVKIIIETDIEKRFILEILGTHNFIATNIFSDFISKSTVIALSEVVVCYLNVQIFMNILETNGRFATDVLKYMNTHGGIRFNRLSSISLKQSRGKMADVLLYVNSFGPKKSINKYLSRKDLAEMANISTENAIRTLREFENEKVIQIDKKEIEILDLDLLKKISQKG